MAAKKLEVVASKNYDGGHAAQNHEPLANPSLSVPALPPANCNQVLGRQISEWREGFNVVRAWMLPHAG